jgi:hypothetical protein
MPRVDDRRGPASTSEMPAVPRLDELQNPGVTSEFARPDFNAPRPGGPSDTGQFPMPGYNGSGETNGQQSNGSYVRSDVFGTPPAGPQSPQNPQGNGQFTPSSYDSGSTGQFPAPTGGTVKLAEKYGLLKQVVFIGLAIESADVRAKLRAANPAACAALCPAADKLDAALADETANWVYVRFIPTAAEVKRVHAAGKKVFLVGPLVAGHEPDNWAKGRAAGVDAVLTDYPLECRAGWRAGKK